MWPLVVTALALAGPLSRRTVILGAPLAPAAFLARSARAAEQPQRALTPLTFLITGANSGIGLEASRKLVAQGHNVLLACRTQARADAAALAVTSASATGTARGLECDLASLASVRRCATGLKLSKQPIDVLVLNAAVAPGGQQPSPKRTLDGFEETIGVNHLGHFLLAQLLLPELEARAAAHVAGRPSPRIVVTASEVHNPLEPGGQVGSKASLGELAGLKAALSGSTEWAMADGGAWDPDKAYKDSKLCNVLFALELDRRLARSKSAVRVNAFSPGLITRTGLFRNQNPLFVGAFDLIANNIARVGETPVYGGGCIEFMGTAAELEGRGGLFYSDYPPGQHTLVVREPSAEARDEREATELWELSEKLVLGKDRA